MNVSLKKAAALATSLTGVAISVPHILNVSIFSEDARSAEALQAVVTAAAKDRDTELDRMRTVSRAVFVIRGLIGKANEGEINALLTERAGLDKELQIINAVPAVLKVPDFVAISRQIEDMRATPQVGTSSYRPPASAVGVPLPFDPATEVRALKKRRITVEDRLASLNFNTNIELPDDVVAILQGYDFI
jgi:hypothetical protein